MLVIMAGRFIHLAEVQKTAEFTATKNNGVHRTDNYTGITHIQKDSTSENKDG